ncbi:hypothetical protein SAICODRAFT_95668 [Saitoella complicata NRRL Y-17804]|uniref:uncharacterized protein n=1 Tax=Saitoella complicata (strain BCRC 22490 / CBS 7301 / JCM 7358 / NBRC 10748 / NRRL Y-17804) TaxID=698492 RepID=UPI0008673665|nr:uncharacterized protein SAICODRAFT_95668 [Saitoella complicata NRRL Y-17804]ODQ51468.1 hypothetical protein SAICODRAFT_95668 [Saitoella complicata NRRL Y-17804]
MEINNSLYALPASYIVATLPHIFSAYTLNKASGGKFTNVHPRTNLENLKDKVSHDVYTKAVRAEAAHKNNLEGFPLFATALLAGNFAGVEASLLNKFAAFYVGGRVLYNALYTYTTREATSQARSVLWLGLTSSCLYVLVKAAQGVAAVKRLY